MKNIIIIAIFLPLMAIAQQVSPSIKVVPNDVNTSAISIVGNTNQAAPWISVNNGSASVFTVAAGGTVRIYDTNTQVQFNQLATIPATTNLIVGWIKVSVNGDTNGYRLPLYK